MYIVDPQAAREAMRSAFGAERYAKFVSELNGRCQAKKRLFYWQESMWDQVQKTLGTHITDFEEVSNLFRHCHVHGSELKSELVPVLYGTHQLTGKYIDTMESLFPHANSVFLGPCWHESPTERKVFFCELCREAREKWEAQRGA
ncbi:hypothetical protein GCM10025770_12510 [Viridibacterium curvum]|uniref:Uncharacterized protein n=1 Tax=Viridibacterium curvum TaxID=1101404 RepID=A0ABP9QHR7_9RHOO